MLPRIFKIAVRDVKFHKKQVLYQVLIIALLSSVITGSLLTGWSVRTSLKKAAAEHMGNTGILISSGARFFEQSLVQRLAGTGINCAGLTEINGYCQNLANQKQAFNAKIFAVGTDFFPFHGDDSITINRGEVAVNEKLAAYLGLNTGDELIIKFKEISDIPSDAPFAPSKGEAKSVVMKVGLILAASKEGNFSLSISQIMPMNIFINILDLSDAPENQIKINRLILGNRNNISTDRVLEVLKSVMRPSDIGLKIIPLKKTGGYELRSDRIFLDKSLVEEVEDLLPGSAPLITYMWNRFTTGTKFTPYSFVSALPSSLYPEIVSGNDIIVNKWLSEDLSLCPGDTIVMSWYAPDSINKLIERSCRFCVRKIVEMEGIWADSLLMPDFPGISGSESCSEWDAGMTVDLDYIRPRDENYWKRFRGTPKAFLDYRKGIELWGSNFGPATAIRIPENITGDEISAKLSGHLDPGENGFSLINLYNESFKAASEGIDFSTLFLSLGFFLILAASVLLTFAITSYLESKQNQIRTYFALGFTNRWILQLFAAESGAIVLTGCFTGSFAGIFAGMAIIELLNTVWHGAVQTDTLSAFFSIIPILTGFLTTAFISLIILNLKIRLYLKNLNQHKKLFHFIPSGRKNSIFMALSFCLSIVLFIFSQYRKEQELLLSFSAGSVLLIAMILFWRQFIIRPGTFMSDRKRMPGKLSRLYYSYYPSHAVTPVLFIAAGIFAVFATGANRMNIDVQHLNRSDGTGGFLLWCETAIPVMADLTTRSGREALGLNEEQLSEMRIVRLKRSAGNDASCLNLNHIAAPALLGVDPNEFISRKSFSFSTAIGKDTVENPWQYLNKSGTGNTIYGIADQTVLQWGLKLKPGDTLMMRSENGQRLNIIIAAGLKSSVFQGYVMLGMENFRKYYPSVAGSSIFLADGNIAEAELYKDILKERLDNYGINIELTSDRLASFYEVTNTYLSVFGVLGALGMITGIAGLGFVLLRNYNLRKKEFALLMASGFAVKKIRKMILTEQMIILIAGIISGVIPAVVSTLPTLMNNRGIPWLYLLLMITAIAATGSAALFTSVRTITGKALSASLKKD
jgi:putative ABC transport system permease protein